MASSLRNFFITFVLALLIFGGLAWHYYGDLQALLPTQQEGTESSEAVSTPGGDTSSGSILIDDPSNVDPGDGLGILNGLVVMKNQRGEVMRARFVRLNSDKRVVVCCDLSQEASLYNSVNVPVPLKDYMRIYPIQTSAKAVCGLTGYEADFYLEITPESLEAMVNNLFEPTYFLSQDLVYVNPIYQNYPLSPDEPLPEEYYLKLQSGEITLDDQKLAVLKQHYETCDGTDGHESYERLLSELYLTMLRRVVMQEKSQLETDPQRLARIFAGCTTNLDDSFAESHASLLLKYMDEQYEKKEIAYTSRDATVHNIKLADR